MLPHVYVTHRFTKERVKERLLQAEWDRLARQVSNSARSVSEASDADTVEREDESSVSGLSVLTG